MNRTADPGRTDLPPRYVPDRPFPPYSFVPGRFPHPETDPEGHSYGRKREVPSPPDPVRWTECQPYLYGIDLFNHGYYWEAHELWEGLWTACGRTGPAALFFKGLIKLAAAGVKVRQGMPEGVRGHAEGARELFEQVAAQGGTDPPCFMGLSLRELSAHAADVAAGGSQLPTDRVATVEVVFRFVLRPV